MHILVAIDESSHAATVLTWMREFPHPPDTRLTLAHVIEPFDVLDTLPGEPRSRVERRRADEAQAVLERATLALRKRYREIKCSLRQGSPIYELLSLIREQQPDIVVTGTRGLQSGRGVVLGSVSQRLLSYAPCSILLIPAMARLRPPMQVLLATDGSRGAKRAAEVAAAFPRLKRIEMVSVVRPVDKREVDLYRAETGQSPASIREQLRRLHRDAGHLALTHTQAVLKRARVATGARVVVGSPAEVLPREAKRCRCDLLVMGSRGLRGQMADIVGSVSSAVAQQSTCPVLVVKRPIVL